MKLDMDKYKFFFFDFDGVIADSLDVKTQAFGKLFKDYGKDVVKKVIDYHMDNGGVSRYEKFRYYYRNILNKEITQEIIDELDRKFSEIVAEKVASAPFIEGVMDFIRKLNERKKECFIISATPQKEIKDIARLRRIDGLFKEIVGSPAKKKENLKKLLKKYNINQNEAVYFGDARSDYEAAAENDIDFIGITRDENSELEPLSDIYKMRDFTLLNEKETS